MGAGYSLPDDVIERVFKNIDWPTIQSLRKTSYGLRELVERTAPTGEIISVDIISKDGKIILEISIEGGPESKYQKRYPVGPRIRVEYEQCEAGVLVQWTMKEGNKRNMIEDADHIDLFIEDFVCAVKDQPKPLKNFWLNMVSNNDTFLVSLKAALEECNLKVECFGMKMDNQDQVMHVLPFLDHESIQRIRLQKKDGQSLPQLDTDKIVSCRQWMKAKEVDIADFKITSSTDNFVHFATGRVAFEFVSSDEIVRLTDAFNNSNVFISFSLTYIDIDNEKELIKKLGDHTVHKDRFQHIKYKFENEDSNLSMELEPPTLKIKTIVFEAAQQSHN